MRRLEAALPGDTKEPTGARPGDDRPVASGHPAVEIARRLHHEAAAQTAEELLADLGLAQLRARTELGDGPLVPARDLERSPQRSSAWSPPRRVTIQRPHVSCRHSGPRCSSDRVKGNPTGLTGWSLARTGDPCRRDLLKAGHGAHGAEDGTRTPCPHPPRARWRSRSPPSGRVTRAGYAHRNRQGGFQEWTGWSVDSSKLVGTARYLDHEPTVFGAERRSAEGAG